MRYNTSGVRVAYAPACTGPFSTIKLHSNDGAKITVDTRQVEAWLAFDDCLRHHGYLAEAHHTGAFVCRRITSGTGWSQHAFGTACDLNWLRNPYRPDGRLITDYPDEMIADILAIRTVSGELVFGWGGNWSKPKDTMHWECLASLKDLASGIIPPYGTQPVPPTEEEFELKQEDVDYFEGLGGRILQSLTRSQGVKPGDMGNDTPASPVFDLRVAVGDVNRHTDASQAAQNQAIWNLAVNSVAKIIEELGDDAPATAVLEKLREQAPA